MSDQAGTPTGADSTAEVDETAEMTFAKLTELAFRGGEMALAPATAVGVASPLVACPLAWPLTCFRETMTVSDSASEFIETL